MILLSRKNGKRGYADHPKVNFFSFGLKYLVPDQERFSSFTQLTEDHNGKIASVLAIDVTYSSATGKNYSDSLVVDMSELKGSYELGKPNAYAITQSLEKIQKDIHHFVTGFHRIEANIYTIENRVEEIAKAPAMRELLQR